MKFHKLLSAAIPSPGFDSPPRMLRNETEGETMRPTPNIDKYLLRAGHVITLDLSIGGRAHFADLYIYKSVKSYKYCIASLLLSGEGITREKAIYDLERQLTKRGIASYINKKIKAFREAKP